MIFQPSPQDPAGPPGPPPIDAEIEAAARLAGLEFDEDERAQMEPRVRRMMARTAARRADGLPPNDLQPQTTFAPDLDGPTAWLSSIRAVNSGGARVVEAYVDDAGDAGPVPSTDLEIALAPAWKQAAWIRGGGLSSVRLTQISLDRIARLDPKLKACITVTEKLAMKQAEAADRRIQSGEAVPAVTGLTWGAKDLLDTADIPTTWGAAPFQDRVPSKDAAVVKMLHDAGAVMVAKTSLGALAMGDVWFGGRTRNPWNLEQGSSGSSAGSAAGVAAGLFSFALGTETYGSIVSPATRCGTVGMRPTFGRVDRSGAMALCWSMDKIGPLTRSVRDARMVLHEISGRAAGDHSCRPMRFHTRVPSATPKQPLASARIGFRSEWLEGNRVPNSVRAAAEKLVELGAELVEIKLPDGPHGQLMTILEVESAAAFEELTRSGRDDELTRQDRGAWPNSFRSSWMIPAVEFLQADRYRRRLCEEFDQALMDAEVDAIFSPPFAGELLLMTNFTGHPCLTVPVETNPRRASIALWGHLGQELELCRIGEALETALGLPDGRPPID